MSSALPVVKIVTIIAFMVTLFATYYLRQEVLSLNEIRFSAEDLQADQQLEKMRATYPQRVKNYEIQMKNYELHLAHYNEMMKLYKSDYEEYVKRIADKYTPPQLPIPPQKPTAPEYQDQLLEISAKFRTQQHHYFASATVLNWVVCCSALILTGGLMFLLMFDTGPGRFVYLAVLLLSFIFMIGPSFHSIMSAIVGFMRPPRI